MRRTIFLIFILCIGKSAACTITNTKNITEELKNCEQPIKSLKLQNSSLIEIPSQILDAYDDIYFIDISGVGLESMESTTFCKFGKITTIDFSNNSLTTLPKHMLSECEPNLKDLNFSFNQITELTNSIFIKLTSLTAIDFSSNRIEKLLDDVFKPLVNLRTLRLSNNRISIIDDDLFMHNSNLITLTLNNNMLEAIESGSFDKLKELRTIDLGNNPDLSIIDLSGMYRLQRVQIDNCSLLTLNVPAYGKIINAHGNHISHIKGDQKNELESLDLSRNNVKNLSELSPLKNLNFLDLSENELAEINFSHLATLTNLKRLIIHGNPLKKLDTKALSLYLPSVKEIGISADSLDCGNQENGCVEWMRSNNIRLLSAESASNINNEQHTTIKTLPKPPLTYLHYQDKQQMDHLEAKIKEFSAEASTLRVQSIACILAYFCTFIVATVCVLGFGVYCRDGHVCGINWQSEPRHELLDPSIESDEPRHEPLNNNNLIEAEQEL